MSKKVIGALLAIALVLSVFSFSVFAAGTGYESETDASKYTQIWGLANKQGSDGTYTVDVVLTTDYLVGPVQFQINGVDEVTKVTVGSDYYPAVANAGKSGLVSLIPDTSSTLEGKKLTNAVIATVTYKSASNGTPSMDENDYKSASKPQGSLMAARLEGSTAVNFATFIVGQKPTVVPLGGEMPKPTDADLAVKAGVSGVVIDTHKTFGGKYAGVVYGFAQANNTTFKYEKYITDAVEATDGSALVVTASDAKAPAANGMGNYGTGTTIKVGEKTYVVCIFGDVDGNGLINTADLQKMLPVVNKTLGDNTVITLAANIVDTKSDKPPMHNIQVNDIQAIVNHNGKKKLIDPAALAAAHSTYNSYYQ